MQMNTESLRKILNLEQQRGYTDSAVFGGLDKYLHNWSAQEVESVTNPVHLRRFHRLFDKSYTSMSPEQRREWRQDVLAFLDDMESVNNSAGLSTPDTSTSSGKKSSPKVKRPTVTVGEPSLDSPITVVKGISTALSTKFGKLGVKTVRDLLYFFPHRHLDYSRSKFISQLPRAKNRPSSLTYGRRRKRDPGIGPAPRLLWVMKQVISG